MAAIVQKDLAKYVKDVVQEGGRVISVMLRGVIGEITYTGVHVPQAGCSALKKDQFYEELRGRHKKAVHKAGIHYMSGDFNSRLLQRLPVEEGLIGEYLYNPDQLGIDFLTPNQIDNRDGFMEFYTEMNRIPVSTRQESVLKIR